MKQISYEFLLWCCMLVSSVATNEHFEVTPRNVALLKGHKALLRCKPKNQNYSSSMAWFKKTTTAILYKEKILNLQNNQQRYEVDPPTNLVIKSVDATDGCRHHCEYNKGTMAYSYHMHVIVLESLPNCNATENDKRVIVHCKIKYAGRWPPKMKVSQVGKTKPPDGLQISENFDNTSADYTTFTLKASLTILPKEGKVAVMTSFEAPAPDDLYTELDRKPSLFVDTEPPEYTYKWESKKTFTAPPPTTTTTSASSAIPAGRQDFKSDLILAIFVPLVVVELFIRFFLI